MKLSSRTKMVVPFHDLDVMQIVWHGHYFKYFEVARTNLMQSIDLDWPSIRDFGYAMPIVSLDARYRAPLVYGQEVFVHAEILDFNFPALEIRYRVASLDGNTTFVTGCTRQVYVEIATRQASFDVPALILGRLTAAALATRTL